MTASRCRRSRRRRTRKISWTISLNRSAGTRFPSNRWSGREFRCRVRTFHNETRKSAWKENNLLWWNHKGEQQLVGRCYRAALTNLGCAAAQPYRITATIFRGAVDGRDSSGPRRRRWYLQKEILALAIRRARRKRPRWLCLDDAKTALWCPINKAAFRKPLTAQRRNRLQQNYYCQKIRRPMPSSRLD